MVASKESLSLIWNNSGPKKYPLQIRVSVRDLVVLRSRFPQTRALEADQRAQKNPDERTMAKLANDAFALPSTKFNLAWHARSRVSKYVW